MNSITKKSFSPERNLRRELRLEFRLDTWSKRDLAMAYFPGSPARVAVNQLTRWIKHCEPLHAELISLGYYPKCKVYSRRQVEAIVGFLGEP